MHLQSIKTTVSALLLAVLASHPAAAAAADFACPSYTATTELAELDLSTIERTLFVDGNAGAGEAADGSAEHPFPTILAAQPAVNAALSSGIPTRLVIAAGTYREELRNFIANGEHAGETYRDTLLVIEGSGPGEVIISGSVTHNGHHDFRPPTWAPVAGHPGLYVRDWPFPGEVDPGPWIDTFGFALLPGLQQRSEAIWLNGYRLRQVLTERYEWHDPDGPAGVADRGTGRGGDPDNIPGELVYRGLVHSDLAEALDGPGTFAVFTDPESPEGLRGKVFLRAPEGHTLSDTDVIEVGLWKRNFAPMMLIRSKNNFVLRNLRFQHAVMSPMSSALIINNCENFILEDVEVIENGATGLAINNSRQGTVRRLLARDNGGMGISLGGSRQMLFEDCEASFNNRRGALAGWIGWHASGFKAGGVHNITIRRFTAIGNYANGLWFDVYCTDILVEDSFFLGNRRMGLMFELTRPNGGPQVTRNSVFAYNDNTGVYLSMAANSGVLDSLLVGNGGRSNVEGERHYTQLLYKFRDHPQGPKSSAAWERVVIRGNVLASAQPNARLVSYLSRNADPATQWERVLGVLESDQNTYWLADHQDGFQCSSGAWLDLDGWMSLQQHYNPNNPAERRSTWQNPGLDAQPEDAFTPRSDSAVSKKARAMGVPLNAERIDEYWTRVNAGKYDPPHFHVTVQHD